MTLINEVNKGAIADIDDVFMFRIYNSDLGFKPTFQLNADRTELLEGNNIEVPYIEYFKNGNGERLDNLIPPRYKKYLVVNYPAVYHQAGSIKTPATYYQEGDELPEGKQIGDEKTPAEYYNGTEVQTPANMMANNWFLTLARTPITAPYGVMDSIESTLNSLPQNVPDNFHLPNNQL
jgi:hypothetical protein